MAIISQTYTSGDVRGWEIDNVGPTGSFTAVLADIADYYDQDVPKYGEPGVIEKKNLTRFLFAYSANGQTYLCQTYDMTMSAGERSALFKILRDMTGTPPKFTNDYDYCDEIGQTCQVTVASKTSKKGKVYNYIAGVAPLMEELAHKAPKLSEVTIPGGRRTALDEGGSNDPFAPSEG
jgi:hypothetical protein